MKNREYAVSLFLLFLLWQAPRMVFGQSDPEIRWNGDFADGWRQFDQLLLEQKHAAASSLVEKILSVARTRKNDQEWTRCLVRYTALRISLHGYETSVRFLKEQPWPDDWASASVLNLFYARALSEYALRYSYEVTRREKTESANAVDLKAWSRDQIHEEAQKALEAVWRQRERLGELAVSDWKDYILPNNYPPGIRSTLRDTVSYLQVDMLADTNGWRTDQFSEAYRLNLHRFLKNDDGESPALLDPRQHPLTKIVFILKDLERWHARRGDKEAALEARIELYRKLHQNFPQEGDRKLIRNSLESYLTSFRDVSWWAAGMAQLAEFSWPGLFDEMSQPGTDPEASLRARQMALQGEDAYPGSIGANHCTVLREKIEAPYFTLRGMWNDGPRKKVSSGAA